MKIGIMGGKTSTVGFRALGLNIYPVEKPEDAPRMWKKIAFDELAILFVTEPVYEHLKPEIEAIRERALPVVTVIPAVSGRRGDASDSLRDLVRKAIGSDLFFSNQ